MRLAQRQKERQKWSFMMRQPLCCRCRHVGILPVLFISESQCLDENLAQGVELILKGIGECWPLVLSMVQ